MKELCFEWHCHNMECPHKIIGVHHEIITATSALCKKCKYHEGMEVKVDEYVIVFCSYESTLMNRNGANEDSSANEVNQ